MRGSRVSAQQFSLDQVLEAWTVSDPGNAAFTPPGSPRRTAADVLRAAFAAAVSHLAATAGPDSVRLGLGPPAHPAVPLDHPGAGARLRAACLRW